MELERKITSQMLDTHCATSPIIVRSKAELSFPFSCDFTFINGVYVSLLFKQWFVSRTMIEMCEIGIPHNGLTSMFY